MSFVNSFFSRSVSIALVTGFMLLNLSELLLLLRCGLLLHLEMKTPGRYGLPHALKLQRKRCYLNSNRPFRSLIYILDAQFLLKWRSMFRNSSRVVTSSVRLALNHAFTIGQKIDVSLYLLKVKLAHSFIVYL